MNTILTNPLPVNFENAQKNPSKSFEVEFLMGVIFILAVGVLFYSLYSWVLTR